MEIEVPMMARAKIPSIANFKTSDLSINLRMWRPKKNARNPSARNRRVRPVKTPATNFFNDIFAIDAARTNGENGNGGGNIADKKTA